MTTATAHYAGPSRVGLLVVHVFPSRPNLMCSGIIRPIRVMNITACYVIHGNNKSVRPVDDMLEKYINKNATAVAKTRLVTSELRLCIGRKINFINTISKETESKKKHAHDKPMWSPERNTKSAKRWNFYSSFYKVYTACSGGGGGGAACGSVIQF